jgi:hypothetical protein
MPPLFDPRNHVSAHDARQDKIDVVVGDWLLGYSGPAERALFFRSVNPDSESVTLEVGQVLVPSRIFSVPNTFAGTHSRKSFKIVSRRASGNLPGDRPLFSGKILVSENSEVSIHPLFNHHACITADLELNPTRYVRHQGYVPNIGSNAPEWDLGPVRLRTAAWRQAGDSSLDGNDNLLASPRLERVASRQAWPTHLHRYWNAVVQTFDWCFVRAAQHSGCSRVWRPFVSLGRVENYWEFSCTDAVGLVRELEPHLWSLAARCHTERFPVRTFSSQKEGCFTTGVTGNAPSIFVSLRAGVSLRVYGKTATRVRLEIVHDLSASDFQPGQGHTRENLGGFITMIRLCAAEAARELNGVFDAIGPYLSSDAEPVSVYILFHRVIRAIGNPGQSETVLSILINSGGRIAVMRRDPLALAVRSLVDKRILRATRPYSSVYRLCPEYAMAIAQLRGQAPIRFRMRSNRRT